MPDYSLVPVDYQPDFGYSLVPIDYDPFGDDGATQPAQTPQVQAQLAQTQPLSQPQQMTTGASQPGALTPGVPTTEPSGSSSYGSITAGADDFFRSIPRGILSGFSTAASALGRATQGEMGQDVDAPTPAQTTGILEREITGPLHRPEGRAGKFGASVGEFLGNPSSYLVSGSWPFKAGVAALGGMGSEAGGQLGEGTSLETPLRILGGVLGGVGAARLASAGKVTPPTGALGDVPRSEVFPWDPAATDGLPGTPGAARDVSGELSANAPTGNFYSVLYQTKLKPTSYPGRMRPAHNQEGNENLLQDMESDDAFARGIQNQCVIIQRTPTGLAPRTPPAGFTWHHADEPGVLQLLPREQHDPGSIFQDILHPGRRGGFFKWGK